LWLWAGGAEWACYISDLLYRGASIASSGLLSPPSPSTPPSNLTMVLLVTSDNEQFVVEKDVAERSVLIKNMLEGKSHPSIPRPMPLTRDFFRRRRE